MVVPMNAFGTYSFNTWAQVGFEQRKGPDCATEYFYYWENQDHDSNGYHYATAKITAITHA